MTTPIQASEGLLLIVDDEPMMTDLFVRSVSRRGFEVIPAHDGETAIEIVRDRQMDLSLVITDMTMPGIDGVSLSRALELIAPNLPILIATGHSTDFEQLMAPPNVVGLVNKPYQTGELIDIIRTILNVEQLP